MLRANWYITRRSTNNSPSAHAFLTHLKEVGSRASIDSHFMQSFKETMGVADVRSYLKDRTHVLVAVGRSEFPESRGPDTRQEV